MSNLKIITDISACYPYQKDDFVKGLNESTIIDLQHECKCLLAIGPAGRILSNMMHEYTDYFKMYLTPEEPNGYQLTSAYNDILSVEKTFNLIFGLCKYSNEWREKYFNSPKRIYTFMIYSVNRIFPSDDKIYDVFFSGHRRPSCILDDIYNILPKYNHKIVDASLYGPISHDEKMKLNGHSKISITYALLFTGGNYINYIKNLPNWKENGAFSAIDEGYIPQIKSRMYEAAFSKSIMLHKKDEWNMIEDWFVPGKEFIYYENDKDLEEKINEILKNYGDYYYIAENAYNRAMENYTTDAFIKNYILPNIHIIN